jgi:hypothetical protein
MDILTINTDIPDRQITDVELIQNSAEFLECYARFSKSNIVYFDIGGNIVSPIRNTVSFFDKKTRKECSFSTISTILVIIVLSMKIHISELNTSKITMSKCLNCDRKNYTMKKCCGKIVF